MLNEKMLYQKAFDNTDVITASGGGGGHWVNKCPCSPNRTGTGYTTWVPD